MSVANNPFDEIREKIRSLTRKFKNGDAYTTSDKQLSDFVKERVKLWLIDRFEDLTTGTHRGFSGFTWNLVEANFTGFIFFEARILTGSLIAIFDEEPFVVRSYPEIKTFQYDDLTTSDESLDETVVFQPDLNGINIQTFCLPDGTFWGKTRQIEYINRNSPANRNFDLLLSETGYKENLHKLQSDQNVSVMGVLYGQKLPGGYIRYDGSINYKAYDLIDLSNDLFLPPRESRKLLREYDIPYVQAVERSSVTDTLHRHGRVYAKDFSNQGLEIGRLELGDPERPMLEAGLKIWSGL